MAENTSFVLGVLGADFMQMKTSDNIYLKDIVADIQDSLALYNERETELSRIIAHKFTDSKSQAKVLYTNDTFREIGEIENPGNRAGFDVWNVPIPLRRYAAGTKITLEKLKVMSSADLLSFHNGKLIADKKLLVKLMFQAMCTKSPSEYPDCIDGVATTVKAFWNADAADTPRSNGQITFANTHQHYNGVAVADALAEADVDDNLIANITEHEGMSGAQIVIWARTGATLNLIKGLTSYKPIVNETNLLGATLSYQQTGVVQAVVRLGKSLGWNIKIVGSYKEALVVETPDLPTYYILATAYTGDNSIDAPLGWREHPNFMGLLLLSPTGQNPIIGQDAQYRHYYGFGIRNRSAGACLYTHHATVWTEPTFN